MDEIVLKTNEDGTTITLVDVQEIILDILVEFDRIIEKYDLDYTLAYGSELGAIRHNGFIPWDDDIDVFMLENDYLKLVEVLETELQDKYYFQCFEKDNKYNTLTPSMKIKVKNTQIKERTLIRNRLKDNGLFIDIFVLENASESLFKHRSAQIFSMILMPLIVLLDLLHIDSRPLTILLYKHGKRYSKKNKKSKYGAIGVHWTFDGLRDQRLLKKDVFPSRKHVFENHMFRVSNNSESVLKIFYGENYMTPPKASGQFPHHIVDIVIDKEMINK